MDKDKEKQIDILINETNNRRSEINLYVKDINYCLFSFIASLALFGSLYLNMAFKEDVSKNEYINLLAFIISQIEFIILVLAMSLLAGIATSVAHISHLENKINSIAEEHLVFWESKLSYREWTNGALIFIHGLIYVFCLFVFGCLIYVSNIKIHCVYLIIQIVEIIIGIGIMLYIKDERSRVIKFIEEIQNEYQTKNNPTVQ